MSFLHTSGVGGASLWQELKIIGLMPLNMLITGNEN
jgi:hypothetical protein